MKHEELLNEAVAEIIRLDEINLLKVKAFSKKLLSEQENQMTAEITRLAVSGGSFDFLLSEPEIYSVKDCEFLYDSNTDSLIPNPGYEAKD